MESFPGDADSLHWNVAGDLGCVSNDQRLHRPAQASRVRSASGGAVRAGQGRAVLHPDHTLRGDTLAGERVRREIVHSKSGNYIANVLIAARR